MCPEAFTSLFLFPQCVSLNSEFSRHIVLAEGRQRMEGSHPRRICSWAECLVTECLALILFEERDVENACHSNWGTDGREVNESRQQLFEAGRQQRLL